MPYTREGILTQVFVALGQGTGALHISQAACRALAERYAPRIDDAVCSEWEANAVQVLERIRAIGRTAAAQAAVAGESSVSAGRLIDAARRVEGMSLTPLCPPDPYALGPSEYVLSEGATREGTLAQICTAFGQGTGAIRLAHAAGLALREQYEPCLDAALLDAWDREEEKVLERVRSIGRAVAARTSLGGGIVITRAETLSALESLDIFSNIVPCTAHTPAGLATVLVS
jgi:hypothetical protein